jgi:hypothetical protein
MSKLLNLFKEEDAPVTEAYFTRLWPMPATHQTGVGNGIMGGTEGSVPDQRSIWR